MTDYVDQLLSAHPRMRVKDKPKVEVLLKKLVKDGCEKLQLIIDFDHTLTKTRDEEGTRLDCSWGVMENSPLLPETYTKECNALRAKYLPIELDPDMPIPEKIPHMIQWYAEANKILQNSRVRLCNFPEMVEASNVTFRDGTNSMFDFLAEADVPVLILSAGLGDIITEILLNKGVTHENIKVVSNFLKYDKEGYVTGLKSDVIHVYNKNENAIHDSDYFKVLQNRCNCILLGDSPGDLNMADGMDSPDGVLKIGFLNTDIEQMLPAYLDMYDIVLVDDQSMDVPFSIIKKIGN